MTAPTRSRRFKFSLRALFVLVTIVGVWLGVQVNSQESIVRERSAMRQWVIDRGGNVVDDESAAALRATGTEPKPLSAMRRMLGDKRVWVIEVPASASQDYGRVSAVFDDAVIILKP